MNQMIRILRKDIRLLWIEIGLSLAALVGFTMWEPRTWVISNSVDMSRLGATSSFLQFLAFISWTILIVRLVHLERLAALNQFWTTRPYEWWQLLSAKFLFLQIFIALPLALSQVLLLHEAHLGVAANVGPLLLNLLRLNECFILPMACVAALTVSFAQSLTALLGVAIGFALASWAGWLTSWKLEPVFITPLLGWLCAVLLCGALVVQYSRRRLWVSLGLAVAAPGLAILLHVVLAGSPVALAAYGDPSADSQGDAPVKIEFITDPIRRMKTELVRDENKVLRIHIPLAVSPQHSEALREDGRRFTFTNEQGYTWQTPWLGYSGAFGYVNALFPDRAFGDWTQGYSEEVALPWNVYQSLGDGRVTVRVELAMGQMKGRSLIQRNLPGYAQAIPGVGFCSYVENRGAMKCLAAFREDHTIRMRTTNDSCLWHVPPESPNASTLIVSGNSILPSVSPVTYGWLPMLNFCEAAGQPVEFDEYRVSRHIRVQTPPVTILLKDYAHTN